MGNIVSIDNAKLMHSNAQFLEDMFSEPVWTTSTNKSSLEGGINGNVNDPSSVKTDITKSNYYCVSSLISGKSRKKDNFESLRVVMLDDVGTRCDYDKDYTRCAYVHDEVQLSVVPSEADHVAQLLEQAAPIAGDYYGFRVPIAASADQGNSWAATH